MRIRTIKPEFWQHEGMSKLPEFSRLLAIALLNYADDEGYFNAHPSLIRGNLFPFQDDSKNILGSIQDLSRIGYLEVSKAEDGRDIGKIINFDKHQRIDKPQKSKIKELATNSKNIPGLFQEPSKIIPGGNREQGTGNGTGNMSSNPAEILPKWSVTPDLIAAFKANPAYQGIDVENELGKAKGWCLVNKRQCTKKFFVNWLNKAQPKFRVGAPVKSDSQCEAEIKKILNPQTA